MIRTTDGTIYEDRDAYHLALRPLKRRGQRTIRISVRDFLYSGNYSQGSTAGDIANGGV